MADEQKGFRPIPGAQEGPVWWLRKKTHRFRREVADLRHRYQGQAGRAFLFLFAQVAILTIVYALTHESMTLKSVMVVGGGFLVSNAAMMFEASQSRTASFREDKTDRKLRTSDVIDKIAESLTPATVATVTRDEMRRQILISMSSCVAAACTVEPRTVCASLLIRSPDAPTERVRVVARSTRKRRTGIEYPKLGNLAWEVLEHGVVRTTSDVQKQYDGFADRPYKSVISLPISVNGTVIAAVNFDHRLPFLFEGPALQLQTALRPYVRTLALTFSHFIE